MKRLFKQVRAQSLLVNFDNFDRTKLDFATFNLEQFVQKYHSTNHVANNLTNHRTAYDVEGKSISSDLHRTSSHIAVIGGGMSSEREVSYISSQGIIKSLVDMDYSFSFIDMGKDIVEILTKVKPDIIFNALHGTYGEDGTLPAILNVLQIPYTGSGLLSSSVLFNKELSRHIFNANNILTLDNIIVHRQDKIKVDPMQRPYVIKPIAEGSSVGVEIIFEEDDFDFSNYNFPYGDRVIVERYIKGREMQVAVLNGEALGIIEIQLLKNKRFYDYETKYTEGFAKHVFNPDLPTYIRDELFRISELVFSQLNCNGIIRTEFIYDENNEKLYIIEANTHPGMTPMSICPEIAAKCSKEISYTQLVKLMLDSAKFE